MFSKFVWVVESKSKTGDDITKAMKSVLIKGGGLKIYKSTKVVSFTIQNSNLC